MALEKFGNEIRGVLEVGGHDDHRVRVAVVHPRRAGHVAAAVAGQAEPFDAGVLVRQRPEAVGGSIRGVIVHQQKLKTNVFQGGGHPVQTLVQNRKIFLLIENRDDGCDRFQGGT